MLYICVFNFYLHLLSFMYHILKTHEHFICYESPLFPVIHCFSFSLFFKSTFFFFFTLCVFIYLFLSVCVTKKRVEALRLHYNTLDYSSYGGFIYWITPNFPLNSRLSSNRPWLTSGCNQQRKSASLTFVLFIHKPMLELRCLFKVILPI